MGAEEKAVRNFAMTGVAGYIAPRHLKAIQDTGNRLVAAMDPHDSVGLLDSYFPDCDYFREFERFDRHIERLRREGEGHQVDYISICSPNFLHDAHIRFALRAGADAICEKPLVLNPWNCDALTELEAESGQRIRTVLQLRLHPAVMALKERIDAGPANEKYEVDLTYITSRGSWYLFSWKGDEPKSGGLATNIGIHFFDMLMWIFGPVEDCRIEVKGKQRIGGRLELARASVKWFLSIDRNDLPAEARDKGQPTYRCIRIAGDELELSGGFPDLHIRVHHASLAGGGYGPDAARPSIELVHRIRQMPDTDG